MIQVPLNHRVEQQQAEQALETHSEPVVQVQEPVTLPLVRGPVVHTDPVAAITRLPVREMLKTQLGMYLFQRELSTSKRLADLFTDTM